MNCPYCGQPLHRREDAPLIPIDQQRILDQLIAERDQVVPK